MPLVACLWVLSVQATPLGQINGLVQTPDGQPQSGVIVRLLPNRQQTTTTSDGTFTFKSLPLGDYQLVAESARYGAAIITVVLDGPQASCIFTFDFSIHQELTVSASHGAGYVDETVQTVSVLSAHELDLKLEPTLGETLRMEPGVSSSSFGVAANRPVIRGMSGSRVSVLEGGIESGDVSTVSADHAISADTESADRIEILRGAASLRFGSNATGGVVNIIDDRIPDFLPDQRVTGRFRAAADSGSNARKLSADLDGALYRIAWHVDFLERDTDDYKLSGSDPRSIKRLGNSSSDRTKFTFGAAWVTDRGKIGAAVTDLSFSYGLPDNGDTDPERVRINQEQLRFDVRGSRSLSGPLEQLDFQLGVSDYEHIELEGEERGSQFINKLSETRFEAKQRPWLRLNGSFGAQYRDRDFEAIGEEAFVPANSTRSWGIFAVEEYDRQRWSIQSGLRIESQSIQTADSRERRHTSLSWTLGAIANQGEPIVYAINYAQTHRSPSPEELFSLGPHLATDAFEVGNADLELETTRGFEFSLRKVQGRVRGDLSLFRNEVDDYIYEQRTGRLREGLDEYRFTQDDAVFLGGELHIDYALLHTDPHHLDLEVFADTVRAELHITSEPLPRIPPLRSGLRLRYEGSRLWTSMEFLAVAKQSKTARLETETAGYELLQAHAGYHFFWAASVHEIRLKVNNLTDAQVVEHTSFIKQRAPLPGRNWSLEYDLRF